MNSELDKTDRRILAVLQKDARRPAELIGSDIGLSASAVQRRIVRMREEGIIVAEVAVVDPKRAGLPLTMIVDVEVERERPELLASLKQWIATEPRIQEAWYVTGAGDYVLIVVARDVDDFEALMQRLVADNANVRRFQTRVALSTLKRGMLVPLDLPSESRTTRPDAPGDDKTTLPKAGKQRRDQGARKDTRHRSGKAAR
ncbi:Lrp/AsnC family transcriptional regulator [Dyella solisilvae]|uniref:Lrp/AsnC family transcriptional regulator n=1 Tax=Dyella solisilvae TaxID=1920168 RepID=A0A370K2I2_9GAMM|nr:Lrp/AsnC family transcriptional regulator [Dyella solisilvae]RDI96875.1 Lrp/AsnC family transcriptional regulator [Dyella solisilvae]